MNNSITELKNLLEGKTVLKIEEPHRDEAICNFILSDGTAFRLHATDLGFWTEGINGYQCLNDVMMDYAHEVKDWSWKKFTACHS